MEIVAMDMVKGEQRSPKFIAKSPAGTLPALETDNGRFIGQSTTILQYLEEKYPAPDMTGATVEDRARTLDLLMLVNEMYNFAGICTYHASPLFAERRKQTDDAARAMHFEYVHVAEAVERAAGDDDYLGGSNPSIADVTFFASEQFMRDLYRLRLPGQCVKLEAICQRFLQRASAVPEPYLAFVIQNAPLRDFHG